MAIMYHEMVTEASQDCAVCAGLHDQDIHDATTRVHGWFRQEIERRISCEPVVEVIEAKTFAA